MTPATRAQKTERAFYMDCAITTTIAAPAERIWALLTDAAAFPRWNSTVTRIEGEIAEGHKLAISVPISPKRVFSPRVTQLEANRRMTWSDGMAPMFKGVRVFELTPDGQGMTRFSMTESFSGLMLPLIKGSLPDFGPVFETYAEDLKREAERTRA